MKNVIAGLEEGLQAIAEALEGDSIVPTPAAADEGKVLTANDDGTASWEDPEGGLPASTGTDRGKVLTVGYSGDPGWVTPTKEIPDVIGNHGKVLMAGNPEDEPPVQWIAINQVPSGGSTGQVLTKTTNGYGWAAASGGGGNIDVLKISVDKSEFSPSEGSSGYYEAGIMSSIPNALTKINNMIGITIVDNVDSGHPAFMTPQSTDECSIYYDSGMVMIKINSAIYSFLGSREANKFYLTYYNGQ